jgi:hypothetical protein
MPSQEVADRDGVAGAFVNCWVPTEDFAEAEAYALGWIHDEGWTIVAREEARLIPPEQQTGGSDAERIREAREHGGSVVLHTWIVGGERNAG